MAATSSATTVWQGDLTSGSGTPSPRSGAFPAVDVSWASRTKRAAGKTSPEELLAAAHASCFCMALSLELGEGGHQTPQPATHPPHPPPPPPAPAEPAA